METPPPSRNKRMLATGKLLFRLTILTLVGIGIWGTVDQAWADLEERGFQLRDVAPGWLIVAGVVYLAALLPSWLFWHRTLQVMGQQPTYQETLRAFYVGHLGKYFPGKALVVVLRTALVRSSRVNTAVAASSVFVETLTMMAVGAFVAAGILGLLFREHLGLLLLALGLMICAGGPTIPPVFRWLVLRIGVSKINSDLDIALRSLNGRLMASGWIMISLGWGLMGFSLWAVLQATTPETISLLDWPLLTACVALAMVAGFLSLLPGGIGVREYVVMGLLAGPYGPGAAAIAAILLRLTWLAAELLLAGLLYIFRPPSTDDVTDRETTGLTERVSSVL